MKYDIDASSPFAGGLAVTPSDTELLPQVTRGLYVGTEGNIAVVMQDGSELDFVILAGWLPLRVSKIKATGTTAADIVALW